jgi:hypothetical protein
MKCWAALLLATTAAAADLDPVAVLIRVRDGVLAHAERIPNYTCVETIVRDWYEAAGITPPRSCDALMSRRNKAGVGTLVRLATTDRLRLDVAMSNREEIYSWAGARKFEGGEINELIPTGAIGTGPFAANLLAIFQAYDPNFVFEGETTVGGRRLLEYSFRVQQSMSHYLMKGGKEWLTIGYTGTLLADPATAELVRIDIRTEELPAATYACEVDTTMEYGMVRLAGDDYLLPRLTRQRFINQDGSEAENAITFSSCREFLGESTVHFGAQAETKENTPAPTLPELPSGLNVTVEMTSTVELEKAAAGDRIGGRLTEPILDLEKKIILVPAGAALEGRLMRVETRYGHPNEQGIALRWETLERNGVQTPISLEPDWRTSVSKATKAAGALKPRGQAIELPRKDETGYAPYHFAGNHIVVQGGLVSRWFTSRF